MRIELSSSEVCSRVQLGNAVVLTTAIVLQSQPISYNLLLHGDGKQMAISPLVMIFLVQNGAHSVRSFSTLKNPDSFACFQTPLFIFQLLLRLFYGFLCISLKMQSPTLSGLKMALLGLRNVEGRSQSQYLLVLTIGRV